MPQIHLNQPALLHKSGFTYSACGPFTKNKERVQKFKENKLDKACFQHNMAYGDFKDLTRRAAFDKILRDKAFNTANNTKYHKNENISDQRPSNLATR